MPDAVRHLHGEHRGAYLAEPVTRAMGAGLEMAGLRRDGSQFPVEIALSAGQTDEGLP